MNMLTRLAAALVLSGLLLAVPAAQAAPSLLGQSSNFELEVSEMELEAITADDPRPQSLSLHRRTERLLLHRLDEQQPHRGFRGRRMAVLRDAAPVRRPSAPSPTGASTLPAG